jgi:peptide deformylase
VYHDPVRIHRYPHPCLLREAEPVEAVDGEVRALAAEMLQAMYEGRGIGLAAPQVGVSKRLIVVNVAAAPDQGEEIVLANPKVVDDDGEVVEEDEGCLSLPGISRPVCRRRKVVVRGRDLEGAEREIEAQGLLARVLQHEIDHLDGILFISKISPADMAAIKPKLRELRDKARKEEC